MLSIEDFIHCSCLNLFDMDEGEEYATNEQLGT